MQKVKIKIAHISQTPLSTFRKILEIEKIKIKKKQTLHQKMILRNSYYLDTIEARKEDQILVNECSIIRMKSNDKKP